MNAPVFTDLPDWTGRTVVIIGGGPSLTLKQVRHVAMARLNNKCRVIAVNDAAFVAWWADWLHGSDFKWWNWNRTIAPKFPGIRTTLCDTVPAPWVTGRLISTGDTGFDVTPGNVRHGSNGVYQAMHCTIKTGVKKIVLVGVDMRPAESGETHWHGRHQDGIVTDYAETMIPKFETLKPALLKYGVKVVNCSPGSALRAFRTGDLQEELPHG